jgi:mannose/cellobiose epimerase-like protein (N-acyl-D-glucosamine 2-epimerase family)
MNAAEHLTQASYLAAAATGSPSNAAVASVVVHLVLERFIVDSS